MSSRIILITIGLSTFLQACIIQETDPSNNDKIIINKQSPFYTNELPDGNPRMSKDYDSTKIENYYPFIIYNDGSYMIAAEIESKELFDKYTPVFEKYNYSGNGYCWEGHIIQILQEIKPSLLNRVMFDPEAGGFYAFADSEQSQREFAQILSNVFNDIPKLESYLNKADRSKIDD